MKTIERTADIYGWACEYHVMGVATFNRGWCLCELGVAKAEPILYAAFDWSDRQHSHDLFNCGVAHGGADDAEIAIVDSLVCSFNARRSASQTLAPLLNFYASQFSVESDRAVVRTVVEGALGSVQTLDARVIEKVLSNEGLQEAVDMYWQMTFNTDGGNAPDLWMAEEARRL